MFKHTVNELSNEAAGGRILVAIIAVLAIAVVVCTYALIEFW